MHRTDCGQEPRILSDLATDGRCTGSNDVLKVVEVLLYVIALTLNDTNQLCNYAAALAPTRKAQGVVDFKLLSQHSNRVNILTDSDRVGLLLFNACDRSAERLRMHASLL